MVMSMLVQACKDKASTLVKVITVTITQKNTTNFDASIRYTDRLLTSIVDKNDKSQSFNHGDKPNRTVQIGHGTCTHIIA